MAWLAAGAQSNKVGAKVKKVGLPGIEVRELERLCLTNIPQRSDRGLALSSMKSKLVSVGPVSEVGASAKSQA